MEIISKLDFTSDLFLAPAGGGKTKWLVNKVQEDISLEYDKKVAFLYCGSNESEEKFRAKYLAYTNDVCPLKSMSDLGNEEIVFVYSDTKDEEDMAANVMSRMLKESATTEKPIKLIWRITSNSAE